MHKLLSFLIVSAAALAMTQSWADNTSPIGLWKNIDDKSGKPKALIRITESNGELSGKIEKIFRAPEEDQNPKCDKCEDARKGQPIIGMIFMTGLKKDGDEFNGGQILDPDNGKVYKSKMSLIEEGKQLKVRGYIGMPLLGRTQIWVREE